jgi:hypothetical protein
MRIFIPAVLICCLLVSCHFMGGERVSGNGRISSKAHDADNFNRVDVSGAVVVHVRQQSTPSVKIETDENLLEYVEVFTSGNTLTIRSKKGYNLDPSKEIIAYVSAPEFRSIEVSGACDVISDGLIKSNEPLSVDVSGSGAVRMEVSVPEMNTSLSGASTLDLKGEASKFRAEVSGSGDIRCLDLKTEETTLDLSGASTVDVSASKKLNVDASGASTVRYRGQPKISQDLSGASTIKSID